jgi:hypothetical protein
LQTRGCVVEYVISTKLSCYFYRLHKRCNIGKSIARADAAVISVQKVKSLHSLVNNDVGSLFSMIHDEKSQIRNRLWSRCIMNDDKSAALIKRRDGSIP